MCEIRITHLEKRINSCLESSFKYEPINIKTSILINGVYEIDEIKNLKYDSNELVNELDSIFKINKNSATKMMKKKNGVIIFLFSSNCFNGLGEHYSPILSLSKLSFMKSIAKELNAYKVSCFGITLSPDFNLEKNDELLKQKKLNIFALKQKKVQEEEQINQIRVLIKNHKIFSGQLITLGNGPKLIF